MNVERVFSAVADAMQLRVSSLKAESDDADVTRGRQFVMYYAKDYCGLSLAKIAEELGCEVSSVILGVRNIAGGVKWRRELKDVASRVERTLAGVGSESASDGDGMVDEAKDLISDLRQCVRRMLSLINSLENVIK